jgi:hypothetical protein
MDPVRVPPGPDVLHQVRAACRRVVEAGAFVRVDPDGVDGLADELADELAGRLAPAGASAADDPWFVDPATGGAEARAGLALALAAINFGSGYHPHVRKAPGCSGATTMARALRTWATEAPLTADRLGAVTPAAAARIFGQPPDDGPRSELTGLFARALADLGATVGERFGGRFLGLVEAAGGTAAGLVNQLHRVPFFADVSPYKDTVVPFYKRAQLAAADLHRALGGAAPADFTDLDELTAFADNLVPHVLRLDGVLRYDPDLVARIDRGEELAHDSPEEVEIRAGGVHGVECLRAALADRGVTIRSSDLDTFLWRRGGAPRYKAVPRHRTRTVAY